KKDGVVIRDSMGREQKPTLINEAGLYMLVMRSKLPSAEKFSDWVCEEVLPSIRKTGMYINPNAPINPDLLIKIANDMKALAAQRDEFKALAEAKDETIKELEPKAAYCEKILQSPEAILVTVIAKDYGMGGAVFNKLLHSYRIQYPLGKTWVLYREYTGKDYTVTLPVVTKNGGTAMQMLWTQKGRMFLYDFLKARGILPLCEKTMPDLFGGVA
ncbi:MAG: phage antirepressor KilAC domain-containing protein, partial [Selenomonadaceae bacterium]|nr:phage antirepressor KilAC domain-containing protein [Selenomonadaceae bacterium]